MRDKTRDIQKDMNKMEPADNGDLDKALDRIFRKYGDDLEAFFRDTKKTLLSKRQDRTVNKRESYL